jgi:hypothetical protein
MTGTGVRPSFSEEKEAKRLLFLRLRNDRGHGLDRGRGGNIKVFCFFSSEKKGFLQNDAAFRRETAHPAAAQPHKGEGEVCCLLPS